MKKIIPKKNNLVSEQRENFTDNNKVDTTLIVLATYNERPNILKIIEIIKSLNLFISILIVDDNSPDGTGVIADQIVRDNQDVFVIHREKKLGLGSAYIEGFKFAIENKFDCVCEIDADFSHDPKYLVDFIDSMKNYDMIMGSRYMDGISIVNWPFIRLFLSFFANKFVRYITGMPFKDCTGGFKCIKTSALKNIGLDNIMSRGYSFQMEILYRMYKKGDRIKEIPIIFYNRKSGKSKMNMKEVIIAFFLVIYLTFLLSFKKHAKA